jgi:type I restriction enzyme S subunit
MASISQPQIADFPLPLPPRVEQERIVGKIRELLALLSTTKMRRKKAAILLKLFRQAVLATACSGRLTEDWRKGRPDLEPATQFLKRMVGQRVTTVELDVADIPDSSDELPSSWTWTRIGTLFRIDSGEAFKKKDYSDNGLRLFQIANVGFGRTLWDQKHFLPEKFAKTHAGLLLRPGEIVLALNRPILGKCLKVAQLSEVDMPAILYQRLADAIEKRVAAATLRAEKLTQSILAKAFRGELVPTEAELARREGREYEPASVLLERIRKEREKASEEKSPRRGKRVKAAKVSV